MNKFRVLCALVSSVIIMAAPAYVPNDDTEHARSMHSEKQLTGS